MNQKQKQSGDPAFEGFGTMRQALERGGLLHTKRGGLRRSTTKCKGNCGGHIEHLSNFKDWGFCQSCGEDLKSYVHFARLFAHNKQAS